jgi:predicted RNase H-like nuclease (RuvC/YqgF family)
MTNKELQTELKSLNAMLESARSTMSDQEQEIVSLQQKLMEREDEIELLKELLASQGISEMKEPNEPNDQWAEDAIDSLISWGINEQALKNVLDKLSPRWNANYHRILGPEKIIKSLHNRLVELGCKSFVSVNQKQWEVKWRK